MKNDPVLLIWKVKTRSQIIKPRHEWRQAINTKKERKNERKKEMKRRKGTKQRTPDMSGMNCDNENHKLPMFLWLRMWLITVHIEQWNYEHGQTWSVSYLFVFLSCVCVHVHVCVVHLYCSAQLSMFNLEKRYRNKIIIIIITTTNIIITIRISFSTSISSVVGLLLIDLSESITQLWFTRGLSRGRKQVSDEWDCPKRGR